MLIDTHAHLDFPNFDEDREKVIERARRGGVGKIINIGTNFEASRKSIALAEKHQNVFAAVSLHPIDVEKEEFEREIWLKLAQHPKVVAVGETGFDFYHHSSKEKQEEIFRELIEIARKVEKPLVLHSRESDTKMLEVLKKVELPPKPGVIHCFDRNWQTAKEFLNLGFLISYTGNITYKKTEVQSVLKTPLEKIMVETDCPFLTPNPFRGRRNEPLYVKYVAQKISELKGESFEKVAEATTRNAQALFSI